MSNNIPRKFRNRARVTRPSGSVLAIKPLRKQRQMEPTLPYEDVHASNMITDSFINKPSEKDYWTVKDLISIKCMPMYNLCEKLVSTSEHFVGKFRYYHHQPVVNDHSDTILSFNIHNVILDQPLDSFLSKAEDRIETEGEQNRVEIMKEMTDAYEAMKQARAVELILQFYGTSYFTIENRTIINPVIIIDDEWAETQNGIVHRSLITDVTVTLGAGKMIPMCVNIVAAFDTRGAVIGYGVMPETNQIGGEDNPDYLDRVVCVTRQPKSANWTHYIEPPVDFDIVNKPWNPHYYTITDYYEPTENFMCDECSDDE